MESTDRLLLFKELVDDYDTMAEAFAVSENDEGFDMKVRSQESRWRYLVRAGALRKFVLSRSDDVHFVKVLDAVEELLPAGVTRVPVSNARENFGKIATVFTVDEGDGPMPLTSLIEDFIYGSLLHGDLVRWRRNRSRGPETYDFALWIFVLDAESAVRWLRKLIQLAVKDGLIVLPEIGPPASTQSYEDV